MIDQRVNELLQAKMVEDPRIGQMERSLDNVHHLFQTHKAQLERLSSEMDELVG